MKKESEFTQGIRISKAFQMFLNEFFAVSLRKQL